MAVFKRDSTSGKWQPTPLARGPFKGLQGGAISGLLISEIESQAAGRGWGRAISAHTSFLKPVPLTKLITTIEPLHEGGRVSVVDNHLFAEDEDQPSASVRVTLVEDREIDIPGFCAKASEYFTPEDFELVSRSAPHGEPWFMDIMDVRSSEEICWFKLSDIVAEGAGQLAQIAGPADWAHGIARPVQNIVADPNTDLSIHTFRAKVGDWVGVEPVTEWNPAIGVGLGQASLLDITGIFGSVTMSVALTPFPKSFHRKVEAPARATST